MEIKKSLQLVVTLLVVYFFLPSKSGFFLYLTKLILYLFTIALTYIYSIRLFIMIEKIIKKNYVNWYLTVFNNASNTKENFKSNSLIKQISMLIYLSIIDRKRYFYYSKWFIINRKLETIFILIFVILIILIFYLIVKMIFF